MSRRIRREKSSEPKTLKGFVFIVLLGMTGVCWALALLPELTTGKKTGASWELFAGLFLSAGCFIYRGVDVFVEIRKSPKNFREMQRQKNERLRRWHSDTPFVSPLRVRSLSFYRWLGGIEIFTGILLLLLSFLMLADLLAYQWYF